jgi:hypothetical protein
MSSDRAASCTIDIASFVYVFINRPDTDFIDFVRFNEKDPTNSSKTKSGRVGTTSGKVTVGQGAIACVKLPSPDATDKVSTDIRLYYLSSNRIVEARLPNALSSDTDPASAWIASPVKGEGDKFSIVGKHGLDANTRLVDATSYLSAGRTKNGEFPYVIFQVKGEVDYVRYAYALKKDSGDVGWKADKLEAQLPKST